MNAHAHIPAGQFPPMPRQLDLLRFIHGFQIARGRTPTFAEMAAGIGVTGKGATYRLLEGLEERGLVRRSPHGHSREIEILSTPAIPESPAGRPLYAVAARVVDGRMTFEGRRA